LALPIPYQTRPPALPWFPRHAAIAGPGSRACRGAVHRSRLTGLPARHVVRPVPIRDSLASGPGRIRGSLNGTAEPAAPGHGPLGLLEQAAARAALRGLPGRQREAIVLRYDAGLPEGDIAAAMGLSGRSTENGGASWGDLTRIS
jgi:hypothetical protein